jgi:hypothetical protein
MAMLKLGKVVALDSTDALIRRISGSQLVLRLKHGSLRDGLRRWSRIPKSCWPARGSLRITWKSTLKSNKSCHACASRARRSTKCNCRPTWKTSSSRSWGYE